MLDVEDIVTLTSIEIDENRTGTYDLTLAATDYELLPRNAAVWPEPRPYNQIELTSWGSQVSWPPASRVRITAIHGWPSVPPAIKAATIELTAILQVKSPFATNQITQIDTVVEASPQARAILMGLMTNYGAGIHF